MGENLAAVLHRGGKRQRLAAGAGAEIEHLCPRRRTGKMGHKLGALVLDLEPALPEGRLGLDVGVAAGAFDRRDAQSVRRQRRRSRTGAAQLGRDLLAGCKQRVDAQVERRAFGKCRELGHPVAAECLLGKRAAPIGAVGPDKVRRIGKRPAGKVGELGRVEQRRREAVVMEGGVDRLAVHAGAEHQRADGERARLLRIEQPGGGAPAAQGVVDDIADRRPIAGAGEAMRQAPILQRIGGRTMPPEDVVDDLDGSSQPSAKAHDRQSRRR